MTRVQMDHQKAADGQKAPPQPPKKKSVGAFAHTCDVLKVFQYCPTVRKIQKNIQTNKNELQTFQNEQRKAQVFQIFNAH